MSEKIDGNRDKRFCTSCQTMRPTEYGKMVLTGKINRWKCTACIERISVAKYAKQTKPKTKGEGDA
jgi:hypothetical protein